MKKIKLIGTAHPFRGGLAAFNERMAKELVSAGYSVDIETFTVQYPNILFPGKTQFADWEKPKDLNITRSVNSVNPFNWIKTGRRIKKEKPDFVIVKYWIPFIAPSLGTIARIIRKNRHTKVICVADNIIPHEKRIGDKMLTSFFMNSIDGIVPMSKSVENDIYKFRKDIPVKLHPHPLFDNFGKILQRDVALKNIDLDPEFKYILFFGFIRDYKGLDWLLEAFADSKLRNFPVKLIVAGEFYSDPKPYYELIEKLNLSEHIILKTNFISDDEVKNYFCAAHLVAQPYKSATQSGVTQIGYHFNKPMLVTNVGGLSEIIPDGKIGYVTEPNPKSITNALVDFFENEREEQFVENIKKEKEKFSWSGMISTILEVYKKTFDNDNQK